MRRTVLRSLTLVFALAGFATSPALVSASEGKSLVNQKVSFFTVRGRTSIEIFRDFQKRSPIKARGAFDAALGVTALKFDPKVKYVTKNGRCSIEKARIELNAEVFLPKWANYRSADKRAQKAWDKLFADIKRHELVHVEIAEKYRKQIERKVLSFSSRSSCSTLEAALAKAASRLLARHDRDQKRFDRRDSKRVFARNRGRVGTR